MCQFLSVNERKISLDTYEYVHHKKQADVIIYNALIRRLTYCSNFKKNLVMS